LYTVESQLSQLQLPERVSYPDTNISLVARSKSNNHHDTSSLIVLKIFSDIQTFYSSEHPSIPSCLEYHHSAGIITVQVLTKMKLSDVKVPPLGFINSPGWFVFTMPENYNSGPGRCVSAYQICHIHLHIDSLGTFHDCLLPNLRGNWVVYFTLLSPHLLSKNANASKL